MTVPWSTEELRQLANSLEQWERILIGAKDEGYNPIADLVTRIEVHRPETPGEIIGHFVLDFEYVGFVPVGEKEGS